MLSIISHGCCQILLDILTLLVYIWNRLCKIMGGYLIWCPPSEIVGGGTSPIPPGLTPMDTRVFLWQNTSQRSKNQICQWWLRLLCRRTRLWYAFPIVTSGRWAHSNPSKGNGKIIYLDLFTYCHLDYIVCTRLMSWNPIYQSINFIWTYDCRWSAFDWLTRSAIRVTLTSADYPRAQACGDIRMTNTSLM